jgi:hypothetical protein
MSNASLALRCGNHRRTLCHNRIAAEVAAMQLREFIGLIGGVASRPLAAWGGSG